MPAPIVVPIALAIARAIAVQAAKQGVKKLAQNEARIIARKVIAQKGGPKAVSGKSLDRAINIANQSSRSGRPIPNAGGGLRTTYSGPPKGKISKVAATRAAEKAAGPRARREGGNAALRATKPKPTAIITRRTSGGPVVRMGPGKKIDVKLTQRAEGPARPVKVKKTVTQGRIVRDIKSTDFVRPADRTRIVSGEIKPFLTKEKVTVSRGVKRTTNKNGSAITVKKVEPRKAAEVRAERKKRNDAKLRDALTPRVNPARPKIKPKRGKNERDERTATERNEPQGITVRGKFYPDGNRGSMPRGSKQPTIESRVSSGAEKPTRGNVPSKYDTEAGARIDEAVKASTRVKATVKPGKPTKATVALRTVGGSKKTKAARNAELKGIIRNQRKVLKQREIREAGEKIRKAEEAAKIREAAAKRSGKSLLKGRVIENTRGK
jgi:hypothetical protein